MTERNVSKRLAMGLTHGWLTDGERFALPATAGWRRWRFIELVRTVEVGPFAISRGRAVTFVVRVYRDLERTKKFFPIVSRRGSFKITPDFSDRPINRVLEVIEPRFVPEDFVRASEAAALKAIVESIRSNCEPEFRQRRV